MPELRNHIDRPRHLADERLKFGKVWGGGWIALPQIVGNRHCCEEQDGERSHSEKQPAVQEALESGDEGLEPNRAPNQQGGEEEEGAVRVNAVCQKNSR